MEGNYSLQQCQWIQLPLISVALPIFAFVIVYFKIVLEMVQVNEMAAI